MKHDAGSDPRSTVAAGIRESADLVHLLTSPGLPEKQAMLTLKELLHRVFPRASGDGGASREEREFMSAYLDLCLGRSFGDADLEGRSKARCLRLVRCAAERAAPSERA